MKREFLMLAKKYTEQSVSGWFVSEKLDGMRCFWDGGVTKGMEVYEVPWANLGKVDRYVETPICTGLWSRYGNPIHAPEWFTDDLPNCFLDGELFAGRGRFQSLRSTVSKIKPVNAEWMNIQYQVFGAPAFKNIFHDGEINNTNFKTAIRFKSIRDWFIKHDFDVVTCDEGFLEERKFLNKLKENAVLKIVKHKRLPYVDAGSMVTKMLMEVIEMGGEGLMLRHPDHAWFPKREKSILKVKNLNVGEAKVVGCTTARDGKLLGLMGALICEFEGKTFKVSGFTDAERVLVSMDGIGDSMSELIAHRWATANPDVECPDNIRSKFHGKTIKFMYRELTDDGKPKEARYSRG